jgi:predicted transport protein
MGDIKLFKINHQVKELKSSAFTVEKSIQKLIEENMNEFFGITFLASEYSTGKNHGGRIDSLGIDENFCPVILEYKRATNENVINQGLFYMDWLMDHKAEFKLLVMDKLGKDVVGKIEWTSTRLLCIAGDFTRYDEHAVKQINRNIELIRYRKYEKDLILFELVNTTSSIPNIASETTSSKNAADRKSFRESLEELDKDMKDLYFSVKEFILNLDDNVQEKELKLYVAFKKIKNFASLVIREKSSLLLYLKINPEEVELEENFTRDVRNIGHWGTGDLEVKIKNHNDFEKAKQLVIKSFELN